MIGSRLMNPKSSKLWIAILFLIYRSGVKLEQNIELVRVRIRVLFLVQMRVVESLFQSSVIPKSAETWSIFLKALKFQDLFDVSNFFWRQVSVVTVLINRTMKAKSCCWCTSSKYQKDKSKIHRGLLFELSSAM